MPWFGQNGAGKTTLARVLAGLQAQDHGTVEINGTEIPAGDHRTARRAGVDMVYQYTSLVPGLTVAEALELWAPKGQVGGYRRHNIERRWTAYLAEHDIEIDVSAAGSRPAGGNGPVHRDRPRRPGAGGPADTGRTDLAPRAGSGGAPLRATPRRGRRRSHGHNRASQTGRGAGGRRHRVGDAPRSSGAGTDTYRIGGRRPARRTDHGARAPVGRPPSNPRNRREDPGGNRTRGAGRPQRCAAPGCDAGGARRRDRRRARSRRQRATHSGGGTGRSPHSHVGVR